jgi:hypothetical protein
MRTAIVILNWNTREYLERFIPGVIESANDAQIIVADNGSTDDSVSFLRQHFPSVRLICLDKNYGFTGGYNKSLELLKNEGFEYYVLLNTDIELPKHWLEPLIELMDTNPDCGACAPKLHSWQNRDMFEYAGAAGGYIDMFGYPFCRGRVLKMTEKDTGQYDGSIKNVFWATGACLVVRAKLFHLLGGLDSRFFAHMEEIDLCWRLQLRGYRICVVPQSTVWHLGGGTLPKNSPWKLKLNYRNCLLMLENNLALSYSLEIYRKGTSIIKSARYALIKARFMITLRMVLDGISALVYLISGKTDFFKSVLKAHSEYKKQRLILNVKDIEKYLKEYGDKALIRGWFRHWIIPLAIIKKDNIRNIVRKI